MVGFSLLQLGEILAQVESETEEVCAMRRRGRKRKLGRRKPSGDLILAKGPTPAQVAAQMPHRRALGKKASDPLAENELGRMVLRGELEEVLAAAGQLYRRHHQEYLATLSAPRLARPAHGAGGSDICEHCDPQFCLCAARRRRWSEAQEVLADTGSTPLVDHVCLQDGTLSHSVLWLLRLGLRALARHYGLTTAKFGVVGNASSQNMDAT